MQFFLKRPLSILQFVGAIFIVASIVIAKLPDLLGSSAVNVLPVTAILLAMVASANSGTEKTLYYYFAQC